MESPVVMDAAYEQALYELQMDLVTNGVLSFATEAAKADEEDEFSEEESAAEKYKIDRVDKTYVLLDHWGKVIEKNLPKNLHDLLTFIGQYRSRNLDKLETPYPVDYPPWTPKCNKILYLACGIDEDEFVKDVLTIKGWEGYVDTYLKDKAPYILALMILRYFILHSYKKERAVFEHYMGYSYYWAVHSAIFKGGFKINADIMRYTIQNLSYKSKLKSLGSVDAWLYDGIINTVKTYEDRLIRASDYELHYIQEKIRGKFKSAMKTIFRAHADSVKNKNYIFISKSVVGDDSDIIDNTYGVAEAISLADGYTQKFFATPINEEAIKGSVVPGGITPKDLRTVILNISDNHENITDVKNFYRALFMLFLDNTKYTTHDIGTLRFYYEMEKLYKPGNSQDKNKILIKETTDKWLSAGSKTFRNTKRIPTIAAFRKSLYEYFILKIMRDK